MYETNINSIKSLDDKLDDITYFIFDQVKYIFLCLIRPCLR